MLKTSNSTPDPLTLPKPIKLEHLDTIQIKGRERKPIHFHRFRNKRGLTQPDTHGSFWKLTFDKPISGPLALGFGCHHELGMFIPEYSCCKLPIPV